MSKLQSSVCMSKRMRNKDRMTALYALEFGMLISKHSCDEIHIKYVLICIHTFEYNNIKLILYCVLKEKRIFCVIKFDAIMSVIKAKYLLIIKNGNDAMK